MVPFLHSITSYKLKTSSRRFELTAVLPCFQNPLACSLTLQKAACVHTCMLLQGPSEAFKHTGSNKSTEGQGNTASHDSSSCTSRNTALSSESSNSSELDSSILAGQVIDRVVEGAGRAGTSILASESGMSHDLDPSCAGHLADGVAQTPGKTDASILASESGMSSDLDPSCAGHPADGVAQAPGRTHASRSTAEDSNKAAGSALATAEQTAILADLHVFSRYTILLTCPLCIFLLVT